MGFHIFYIDVKSSSNLVTIQNPWKSIHPPPSILYSHESWEFPWNSHEIPMKSPWNHQPTSHQPRQVAMTPGAATSNAAFTCSERRSSRKALAKARRQRSSWATGVPSPRDEKMGKIIGKIMGRWWENGHLTLKSMEILWLIFFLFGLQHSLVVRWKYPICPSNGLLSCWLMWKLEERNKRGLKPPIQIGNYRKMERESWNLGRIEFGTRTFRAPQTKTLKKWKLEVGNHKKEQAKPLKKKTVFFYFLWGKFKIGLDRRF